MDSIPSCRFDFWKRGSSVPGGWIRLPLETIPYQHLVRRSTKKLGGSRYFTHEMETSWADDDDDTVIGLTSDLKSLGSHGKCRLFPFYRAFSLLGQLLSSCPPTKLTKGNHNTVGHMMVEVEGQK